MRVGLAVFGVVVLLLGVPGGGPGGVPVSWSPAPVAAFAQSGVPSAADEVAVGVIVDTTDARSMDMAHEAGFTHAKMIIHWDRLEPKRGQYTFEETSENDLDNVIRAAQAGDMKLVLRVDGAPGWAGGKPSKASPDAVEAFYKAMAAHGRGTVTAYEVLNEPNLPFEWGDAPSPSGYAAFLKAAYRGVKKGDPSALVIGGGLSPATGGAGGTIEDVDFLRGMYAAGIKGQVDAIAIHNYGGNHEPDKDPGDCGICFRRAEIYHQVMLDQGDKDTPVWATEFGWLLDPGRNMGQYDWMRVSADKQADYVVRSYKYARANWPWMTGLLLSNLDASTTPYHTGAQDGMPWFAILNKDYSPRPAWKAFKSWREQDQTPWLARTRGGSSTQAAATPSPSPSPSPSASPSPSPTSEVVAVTQTPDPSQTTAPLAAATPETTASPSTTPSPAATPSPTPSASSATTTVRLRVAKTDGSGVNLRAAPSSTGKAVAILMEGTTVEVIGEDVQAEGRTWRNVRTVSSTSDGVTGWVAAQYLVP